MSLSTIDIGIILAFLGGTLLIGFWDRKRITLEDYWVNSRSTRLFALVATMLSTFIGTGALLALAQVSYTGGIAGFVLSMSFTVYFVLFALFLASRIKRAGDNLKAYTLPDILGARYGRSAGLVVAGLNFVIFILFLAEQFVGAGAFLAAFANIPLIGSTLLAGVILIAYVTFGGLRADVRTDIFQFFVMTALVLLFMPLLWAQAGGIDTLRDLPRPMWTGETFGSPFILFGGFLTLGMTTIVGMDVWQRAIAARDERTAKKGMLWAAFLTLPFFATATLMGMFGSVLFPDLADPNLLVPNEIHRVLPTGLRGVVLAGFFAAVMSTADTCLLIVGQTLVHDFYQADRKHPPEKILRATRWTTFALGLLTLAVAIGVLSIYHLTLSAVSFGVALIPATVGAFFWRRATAAAAIASILAGAGTILVALLFIPEEAFLPGIVISAVMFVVVTLFTRNRPDEQPHILR